MRTLALERQVAAVEQRDKKQKEHEPSSIGTARKSSRSLRNDWIIEPMSTRYTKMW